MTKQISNFETAAEQVEKQKDSREKENIQRNESEKKDTEEKSYNSSV